MRVVLHWECLCRCRNGGRIYHDYQTQEIKRERAEIQHRRAQNELDRKRVMLSRLQEEMQQDKAMLNEELKASL